MQPEHGIVLIMSNRFIELLIIFIGEFRFWFLPQSRCIINLLAFLLFFLLLLVSLAFTGGLFVIKNDGKCNMIGILLNNIFYFPFRSILFAFFIKIEDDFCPLSLFFRFTDLKITLSVGNPFIRSILTGLSSKHLDLIGNHESRVEPDAELADKVWIFLCISGKLT